MLQNTRNEMLKSSIRGTAEDMVEKLDNRRDRQINKLNQEICTLIAELNELMVYNVQQANKDNSTLTNLNSDLEIAKKQAQVEQIIVETQIARRTLDEMVTFQ